MRKAKLGQEEAVQCGLTAWKPACGSVMCEPQERAAPLLGERRGEENGFGCIAQPGAGGLQSLLSTSL